MQLDQTPAVRIVRFPDSLLEGDDNYDMMWMMIVTKERKD